MSRSNDRSKNDPHKRPRPVRDYEVGRGKPPVHTRYKLGQSGNPSGVAKKKRRQKYSRYDAVTRVLTQVITIERNGIPEKMQVLDGIFLKRAEMALKGHAGMIKLCCDDARAYGLLKDPRIKSLVDVLDRTQISSLSDVQLDSIVTLLSQPPSSDLDLTAGQKLIRTRQRKKTFLIFFRKESVNGKVEKYNALTAREALEFGEQMKAKNHSFRVEYPEHTIITVEELRTLAKFEEPHQERDDV